MKEYRERVAKGLISGSIFIIAMIILEVILSYVFADSTTGLSKYFSYGFFSGIIVVALYYIAKSVAALKDEEKLKKMYIEKNDERNLEVQRRGSQLALRILLASFAVALLVASHLDFKIYKTLLYVVLYSAAIISLSVFYYKKKI